MATVIETVDLISKKWHPAIIKALLEDGPLRFNELKESLEGVSGKVLTESLDDLVEKGLVERTVVSEAPRRVEYELTPHGRDLQAAIDALADWGDRHLGEGSLPKILVVDDDPRLANMHAGWLESTYRVETAFSGEEALRKLTADVDVVLLDRRMPGMAGEEVLEAMEGLDVDPAVVMLTAVEPDFDVVELGIEDYLVKPGVKPDLLETVDAVLERRALDEQVREYLALAAKRRLLQAETTAEERERSEEYRRLADRLDALEAELEDELEAGLPEVESERVAELLEEE